MNEIINFINCYLKLKEDYKEYNKENLYDVFNIFANEVYELDEIVSQIDYMIKVPVGNYTPQSDITVNVINMNEEQLLNEININEEQLLNEIADVLLTTARLIKEFNLEEPLTEMIEYKYERQLVRELKRFKNNKNELLK